MVYFESFVCGPLFYRSKFLFQFMEKGLFSASVVLFSCVEYYFLSVVIMELV